MQGTTTQQAAQGRLGTAWARHMIKLPVDAPTLLQWLPITATCCGIPRWAQHALYRLYWQYCSRTATTSSMAKLLHARLRLLHSCCLHASQLHICHVWWSNPTV